MELAEKVRARHIRLMEKTAATLGNIVASTTPEAATTYRDGGDGWTVLEVLCHLRDFDEIFYQRVIRMLEEDQPELVAYDHELLAEEGNYNAQDLHTVYEQLKASRARFVAYFHELTPEQWARTGIHPEAGIISPMDSLMQVGHHDADHIEQITRILAEAR